MRSIVASSGSSLPEVEYSGPEARSPSTATLATSTSGIQASLSPGARSGVDGPGQPPVAVAVCYYRKALRREVARIRVNPLIGGSTKIEGVVPGPCSWPGLGLTCVAGVPGGVRSIRQKPKGARSIRSHRREADRTGEELKPLADVS
jgi:hypothetical protein